MITMDKYIILQIHQIVGLVAFVLLITCAAYWAGGYFARESVILKKLAKTKVYWFNGAPPSIGWWPASSNQWMQELRWWDGKQWSYHAYPYDDAKAAAAIALIKIPKSNNKYVQWGTPWW